VRWLGAPASRRCCGACTTSPRRGPRGLVTYANYPTTEYLQLGFLDLVCFNVYLEQPDGCAPTSRGCTTAPVTGRCCSAEIGLDSCAHWREAQAHALDWQVRLAFATGCAGTFVYAWTDEWHRGGEDVFDWAFGLTDRDRQPKPAFWAVREAYEEVPFPPGIDWPRVSVVVCSYNGARTLGDCLGALARVEYPRRRGDRRRRRLHRSRPRGSRPTTACGSCARPTAG
jgi:hypothetical protein